MTQQTLAQMVRAKYPGAYDDLSDQALEQQVKAKFPGVYDDIPLSADTETVAPPTEPSFVPPNPAWGNQQLWESSRAGMVESAERMGAQVAKNTVAPIKGGVEALWEATRDPVDAVKRGAQYAMNLFSGFSAAQNAELVKAQEAAAQGDYNTAVLRGGAWLAGGVGPMLDEMQTRMRNGQGPEVAADLFTMFFLPQLAKKVPNMPRIGGSVLGPKEQAATQWALDQKPPVLLSAGEASGNMMAKGAEYLAERGSLLGSQIGPRRSNQMRDGLATIGEQLREKVNPGRGPRRALDAGEQIAGAMGPEGRVVNALRDEAAALYKQATALTGRDAAFAVDVKAAQNQLRALHKQLADSSEKLPTRGDLHQAAVVLDDVMKLDNTVPFMVAETGVLSPLKRVQRGFTKNSPEWGVIQEAINAIDDQVMAGARAGGQGIEAMIKEARLKTAKMHEVIDENVNPPSAAGLGRKVMAPGDTGIETTRLVRQYAPDIMPDVGRAAIEEVFAPSLVKDGINKADSLLNRWSALGAQSKKEFFADAIKKDPNFLSDMDNLILVTSKAAEKANSSNSGGVIAGGTHFLNLMKLQNIPLAVIQEIAGGAVSFFSRNPRVVKLLTKGMLIPTNAIAARAANNAAIYKALGLATAPARAQGAGPVGQTQGAGGR